MAILNYFPKDLGLLVAFQREQALLAELFMACTFDWNGGNYPCTVDALKEGKELGAGGWQLIKRIKIRVRIDALPDASDKPKTNDTLTVYLSPGGAGTKLRILTTENNYDSILEIEAVDTNHP